MRIYNNQSLTARIALKDMKMFYCKPKNRCIEYFLNSLFKIINTSCYTFKKDI